MRFLALTLLLLLPAVVTAYPVDGYDYTGIRRLEFYRLAHEGAIPGPRYPPGQYLGMEQVQTRWHAGSAQTLPPEDAAFSRAITALLDAEARRQYGIVVVDLSEAGNPQLGQHNGDIQVNAGSVGKVLVALAVFDQLARLYPDDITARERILRDTRIVADEFIHYDHHVVPFFDVETRERRFRRLHVGDAGNLWEYLDWMLSPSSSSAAAMAQRELVTMAHFRHRYPVPAAEQEAFLRATPRSELGEIYRAAQTGAVRSAGLDPVLLRQGSFFTRVGKQRVASSGSSIATPRQLAQFLFRMEAGALVDAWSSREMKRLLYMTQRRIRYASHPALNESAVYFKSGSLYQCLPETRPCRKYMGDRTNRLASVAVIESPAGAPRLHYLVAVMSNVLRVNSAVAHQTLAMRIHRLIEARNHGGAPATKQEPEYPQVPVDGVEH